MEWKTGKEDASAGGRATRGGFIRRAIPEAGEVGENGRLRRRCGGQRRRPATLSRPLSAEARNAGDAVRRRSPQLHLTSPSERLTSLTASSAPVTKRRKWGKTSFTTAADDAPANDSHRRRRHAPAYVRPRSSSRGQRPLGWPAELRAVRAARLHLEARALDFGALPEMAGRQ